MIKLVLCDMDGTLVPFGRSQVSERTLAAIKALRAAGIEFGPATGREPADLVKFFHGERSCFETGLMANGKIVDADGLRVMTRYLDAGAVARLAEKVSADPELALIFYLADAPTPLSIFGVTQEMLDAYEQASPVNVKMTLATALPDEPLTTLDVANLGSPENDERIREELLAEFPEFDFVKPGPAMFDILPRGASKATGLPAMEEALHVSREEIAFFGDSENDYGMFDVVPNSFAPANGTSGAKERARYLIGDAADDSVAIALEALAASGGDLSVFEGVRK